MLKIEALQVTIASVQVLRGFSLEVPHGSMVGLVGRNGAGKTSLMRSVMGHLPVAGGSLHFGGADLSRLPRHARAGLGIGYMPEDRGLVPELTVEENILVPAWALGAADAGARLARILDYIPEIRELGPRKGSQLSGGQQKLAALARALMCGTRLLLLDEPFEGVAPALAQRLAEVVRGLKDAGMTVILSESDLQHSERLVDRVVSIDRGAIAQ